MHTRITLTLLAALTGCATETRIDATIELQTGDTIETWATGALLVEALPMQVGVVFGELDPVQCTSRVERSIDLRLPVDYSAGPHVVGPMQLGPDAGGSLRFEDHDERHHLGVAGLVFPLQTTWAQREGTGTFDRIVRLGGTFDVTLDDGRRLRGEFDATPCD